MSAEWTVGQQLVDSGGNRNFQDTVQTFDKHSEHFCTRLPFPLTNFREGLKALSSEKSFISMYTKLRSCLSHWRRAGVVEHLLK